MERDQYLIDEYIHQMTHNREYYEELWRTEYYGASSSFLRNLWTIGGHFDFETAPVSKQCIYTIAEESCGIFIDHYGFRSSNKYSE